MESLRVALVDDHPLFRDALAEVLRSDRRAGSIEIIPFGTLEDLGARLEIGLDLDLIMMDLGLPGLRGLLGLLSFRTSYPAIPIIVVSANADGPVPGRAMMLGAASFIPKSATVREIREAVHAVLAGDRWVHPEIDLDIGTAPGVAGMITRLRTLTSREIQVCQELARGRLNKQIAFALSISEATVKVHVSSILDKLGVSSRTQVVVLLGEIEGDAARPSCSPALAS